MKKVLYSRWLGLVIRIVRDWSRDLWLRFTAHG